MASHIGDIPTYKTRDTDDHVQMAPDNMARPSDFNPFPEQVANQISGAIQGIAEQGVKNDIHSSMVWANSATVNHMEDWMTKIKDYTNPDQFRKDYKESQDALAAQAPNGAAADAVTERTNEIGQHLFHTVLLNQAKAKVSQNTSNWVSTADGVSDIANSNPNLAPDAFLGLKQMLNSSSTVAKGIVPSDTLAVTTGNANQAVDRGMVNAVASQQGPQAAVSGLSDGSLGGSLSSPEKDVLAATYVNKYNTDKTIEKQYTAKGLKDITDAYRNGEGFLSPEQESAFVERFAQSHTGKKGDINATKYQAQTALDSAKQEGALAAQLFTKTPEDQRAFIDSAKQQYGDDSAQVKWAQSRMDQWDKQKATDPVIFARNDPTYRAEYNKALSDYESAKNQLGGLKTVGVLAPGALDSGSADLQTAKSNLQQAMARGMAIQDQGGVPPDKLSVMPVADAKSTAAKIPMDDLDKFKQSMDDVKDKYGQYAPIAFRDMVTKGGLPVYAQILAQHQDEPVAQDMMNAFASAKEDKKNMQGAAEEAQSKAPLLSALRSDPIMTSFKAANYSMGNGKAVDDFVQQHEGAITTLSKYYLDHDPVNYSGSDGSKKAVEAATQSIIGNAWGFGQSNGSTFMIAKGGDKNNVPLSDRDISTAQEALEQMRSGPDIQGKVAFDMVRGNTMKTQEQGDSTFMKNTYWATGPDGRSFILRYRIPGAISSAPVPAKGSTWSKMIPVTATLDDALGYQTKQASLPGNIDWNTGMSSAL